MKLKLIAEGYGRVFDLEGTYLGYNEDPTPKVLSLGRWVSPRGNNLLAGINLHYLSNNQITNLQKSLPSILKDRNLRVRVRKLRSLVPDVFDRAYRTYDTAKINGQVTKGTLKFVKPTEFVRKKPTTTGLEPEDETGGKPISKVSDKIKQRHDNIKKTRQEQESEQEFEKTVDDVEKNKSKTEIDRRDRDKRDREEEVEPVDQIIEPEGEVTDEEVPDQDVSDEDVELEQ